MKRIDRQPRRQRRQAGFNLVEVMVAMVILVVAVVGASKLQYATTRANVATRNRMHASEFLLSWVERVKLDAMAWQTPQPLPALFTGQDEGDWFHHDDGDLQNAANVVVGRMGADFWGVDVAEDQLKNNEALRNLHHCADLRYEVVGPGMIRADVRVWWHREGRESATAAATGQVEVNRAALLDCDWASVGIDPCPEEPNPINPLFYCTQVSTLLTAN